MWVCHGLLHPLLAAPRLLSCHQFTFAEAQVGLEAAGGLGGTCDLGGSPVHRPRGPLHLGRRWWGPGWELNPSPWLQVSEGSLTVTSVSREDRGAYTCRAYSIQGEAVHTTHLLVQGEAS